MTSRNETEKNTLNEALVAAAEGNRVEEAKRLIAQGADVNFEDTEGNSPLMMAVMRKNRAMIEFLLIEAKADPDKFISSGLSAVHMAANKCDFGAVQLLVEAGAKLDVKGDHGVLAEDLAQAIGRHDIAEYLTTKRTEQAQQKIKEESMRRAAQEILHLQNGLPEAVTVRKPLKIQPRTKPL